MGQARAVQYQPGTVIAQFRIERELGRGAMGVVFRAIQEKLERPVALKILSDSLALDQEFVKRFFNEARAAAALAHPTIIQVYDAGVVPPDLYYFAMEYIEGETLYERVSRQGPLAPPEALAIALAIADALNYGWKRQALIHGDIKPENIMISAAGETKLADFGLAKVSGHEFCGDGIMLTPLYAAPELIRGEARPGDCRPDIYSFGATLYHLLCGEPPFPGTDPQQVLHRHLEEAVPPLAERNPKVSRELSDYICNQLLAKDPAARPQDWEQVQNSLEWFQHRRIRKLTVNHDAVERVAQHTPAATAATAATKRGWGGALAALLLLALVAGGAGLLLWWWRQAPEPPPPLPEPPPAPALIRPQEDTAELAWERLKRRLAAEQVPVRALTLLHQYQQRHPRPPPEFAAYVERFTALASRPPAAPEPPPPVAQTEPEPEPPVVQAEPAPEPPPQPAADRRLELEALTEFLFDLNLAMSRFPARPGDELLHKGRRWLEQYPRETDEALAMRLLLDTALPALVEEYLPALVAHKEALRGTPVPVPLPGQPATLLPLRDLTLAEFTVTQRTEHGELALRLSWARPDVDRRAGLTALGKAAADQSLLAGRAATSYLAWLLLSRQPDALQPALAALPEAERRPWLLAAAFLQTAPAEGHALRQFREAEAAAAAGRTGDACRLFLQLKASATAVAVRREPEIARFLALHEAEIPELAAPLLVRQAQAAVAGQPALALQLLATLQARYGRLDFPEKPELPKLQQRALDTLTATPPDLPLERATAGLGMLFTPQPAAWSGALAIPYYANRRHAQPSTQGMHLLPLLQPLALLELGDWAAAQPLLQTDDATTGLNPPQAAALHLAKALVAQRFEDGAAAASPAQAYARIQELRNAQWPANLHRDSPAEGATDDAAARARRHALNRYLQLSQMLADSVLLTRSWNEAPSDLEPERVRRLAADPGAWPWLFTAAAVELEAGRGAALRELLRQLPDTNFGARAARQAGAWLDGAAGPPPMPNQLPDSLRQPYYARFLLAAQLSQSRPPPSLQEREMTAWLGRQVPAPDHWLAAATWYELLLCRVGQEVRSGNAAAALNQANLALERGRTPHAAAYYPRLCLLRAGLEALTAPAATAQWTLGRVRLSPVASPSELATAAALAANLAAPVPRAQLFLGGFIHWAQASRAGNLPAVRAGLEEMRQGAVSLAEKRLAALLAEAAAPAAPAAP